MISPLPPHLTESLLVALDDLMDTAGPLLPTASYVHPDDITQRSAYSLLLSAYTIIVGQQVNPPPELAHQLMNLHFPVLSPWCPVFLPPPRPGVYWLAPAYAPATHVQARWQPARGVPWGRWRVPQVARPTLYHPRPLVPGDRWRNI